MLQSMGSQRVRHDWATELNWIVKLYSPFETALVVKQVWWTLLVSCGVMHNEKFISWDFCTISSKTQCSYMPFPFYPQCFQWYLVHVIIVHIDWDNPCRVPSRWWVKATTPPYFSPSFSFSSSSFSFCFRSMCMLCRFSRVWLFVTQWSVAHQAHLSIGFSRQEY